MLHFLLVIEVLLEEEQDFVLVSVSHGLLQAEHLVADIVTDLDSLLLVLELFSTPVLQYHLALLVCALVLLAPFLVLLNVREEHQLFAEVARNLQDLNELFQDVGARPDS